MANATLKLHIWTEGGASLPADDSDIAELFVPHLHHVSRLCGDGYTSGEIIGDTFEGWWSLERN